MNNALQKVESAFSEKKISEVSYLNLKKWLLEPEFSEFRGELLRLIEGDEWSELDDRFYKIIEFGTGGRRGPRGAGTNRINHRTIAESAQGLADYIRDVGDPSKGVVVSFDTRHSSKSYAREVCRVLAGNKVHAYIYPEPRSTPQLSFSIRYLHTQAGCMISASHNPPSDNGIKVSWADGGQVLPPHDKGIIEKVTQVKDIKDMDWDEALKKGWIEVLDQTMDQAYLERLESLVLSPARDAVIAYSPLHGVGATNVVKLLKKLGFQLHTVEEQMVPDPDFSTVKNHLPNPELPDAMERVTALAEKIKADIAMASDPDADRLGATIPCPGFADPSGWLFLNGNQIGVLILDHVLRQLKKNDLFPENPVVIKTIVTTDMLDAMCADYGVEVINNLLVGFKYIAEVTQNLPPEKTLIFQTEESHGYNRGTFVRDKDSAPAALHLSELASILVSKGETMYRHLNDLYRKYGYFCEVTRSIYYSGKTGGEKMNAIMNTLRSQPPRKISGFDVCRYIDRLTNEVRDIKTNRVVDVIDQHKGNVLSFHFDESGRNRVTARPSGTEPKIKFYAQLWEPVPPGISDEELERLKGNVKQRAERVIDSIAGSGA